MEMEPQNKARPGKGKKREKDAVGESNEGYFVGQVANSLFQNKPTTSSTQPLLELFSAPAAEAQPIYVAVPKENKKRKHAEEEIATKVHSSSTNTQPLKKMKKINKKKFSPAEKMLANREFSLEQADEEEEEKEIQVKQKLKNRHSQLVNKYLSTSDEYARIKQKKTQVNKAEEMLKNKRTLFVGNLPVTCTAQISFLPLRSSCLPPPFYICYKQPYKLVRDVPSSISFLIELYD